MTRAGLRPPSRRATWREGLTAFEPARLALHGPRLAVQPRGDGRTVIVLPGFGAGDLSTAPIRGYLRSLRYDARGWGLGVNAGDVLDQTRSILAIVGLATLWFNFVGIHYFSTTSQQSYAQSSGAVHLTHLAPDIVAR